jgi:aminopeptidase-like protein
MADATDLDDLVDPAALSSAHDSGPELYALVNELYPICRSITGDGVRQTLGILSRYIPLTIHEVPTGTPVLDWTVPKEWNIRDAWIADASGKRIVDFRTLNLHVLNYSVPVRKKLTLQELRPHLFTLPDQPELVPYRTSYWSESWGFCLSQRQLDAMPDGEYEVCIDSTLEPGSLTYGEFAVPGTTEDEILISAHTCHPSLCDDNLTGLAISAWLARAFQSGPPRRYGLRFLYAPGTIGAITWLSRNRDRTSRIRHGLTLTCLGDSHPFTFKKTVSGTTEIDRAAALILKHSGLPHQTIDFFPYGYDERQYNSPGFRMPVGSLMRGRHGKFPEYHTSADNPSLVSAEHMAESLCVLRDLIDLLQANTSYQNLAPWGEPQLGKRGLYQALGGTNIPDLQLALLWVLNLSDGQHTLLDIAERSGMSFRSIRAAADLLHQHALLSPALESADRSVAAPEGRRSG